MVHNQTIGRFYEFIVTWTGEVDIDAGRLLVFEVCFVEKLKFFINFGLNRFKTNVVVNRTLGADHKSLVGALDFHRFLEAAHALDVPYATLKVI